MESMFAYETPQNGLTFDWAGMWGFGALMIAVILVIFMFFFREPDGEIAEIEIPDSNSETHTEKAQA